MLTNLKCKRNPRWPTQDEKGASEGCDARFTAWAEPRREGKLRGEKSGGTKAVGEEGGRRGILPNKDSTHHHSGANNPSCELRTG